MGGSKRVGNARAVRRSLVYGPPTVLPFSVFVLLCAPRSPRFFFFFLFYFSFTASLSYVPPPPPAGARKACRRLCLPARLLRRETGVVLLRCWWCAVLPALLGDPPAFLESGQDSSSFFLQPPLCFNLFVLGVQISGRERKENRRTWGENAENLGPRIWRIIAVRAALCAFSPHCVPPAVTPEEVAELGANCASAWRERAVRTERKGSASGCGAVAVRARNARRSRRKRAGLFQGPFITLLRWNVMK